MWAFSVFCHSQPNAVFIARADQQTPITHDEQLRVPSGEDNVFHYFYLPEVKDTATMRSLLTELRKAGIANIDVEISPTGTRAIVMRGTEAQVTLATDMIASRQRAGL